MRSSAANLQRLRSDHEGSDYGCKWICWKNLAVHLKERKDIEVLCAFRDDDPASLITKVAQVDFIFHLAGVNRPKDVEEFKAGNTDLTQQLADAIVASGRKIPLVYTSSTQAAQDNAYGLSKLGAEDVLTRLAATHGSNVYLFRLPNVLASGRDRTITPLSRRSAITLLGVCRYRSMTLARRLPWFILMMWSGILWR